MSLEVSVFYYSMSVFFKVSAMTRLWARKSTDCMGYVSGLHSKIICRTFKTKLFQPHLRLSKSESLGGGTQAWEIVDTSQVIPGDSWLWEAGSLWMNLSRVEENRKEYQCNCNMGKVCVCYVLGWNAKCISHWQSWSKKLEKPCTTVLRIKWFKEHHSLDKISPRAGFIGSKLQMRVRRC